MSILAVIALAIFLFFRLNPQFGGRLTREWKEQYAHSPQWDGKQFVNQTTTEMSISLKEAPALLREQFSDRASRSPQTPLPILPFDAKDWSEYSEVPAFVWYGHSVLLLRIGGKTILIDPMFGPDASPIAPFQVKRFSTGTLALIETLPKIDAVLLTHDHYDHLDLASFRRLKDKVSKWIVSLGNARHLLRWGVNSDWITEMDWWDQTTLDGISITATPARHFSGRGLTDRGGSLWSGFVLNDGTYNLYWSGDGGYGAHFKEVGEKLGPFDWGFMECGQYNERWHAIHMYPEETVQASHDALVKSAIPVHWGGFPLALHPWKDPIERFTASADDTGLNYFTPRLGEMIRFDQAPAPSAWWQHIS